MNAANAIRMAFDDINAKGGILGRKIDVSERRTGRSGELARTRGHDELAVLLASDMDAPVQSLFHWLTALIALPAILYADPAQRVVASTIAFARSADGKISRTRP